MIHDIEEVEWAKVFTLPYNLVRDTKLQSFQYKLLNRLIPCQYNLHLWKLANNNQCLFCAEQDTIEHLFYECHTVQYFWESLENWIANTLQTHVRLSILDILFGTQNESHDPILFHIDYCVLIGKWYIHTQRLKEKSLFFIEYLQILKGFINTEKYILCIQQKQDWFERKWKLLYDALN